jgi:hypothetical protein
MPTDDTSEVGLIHRLPEQHNDVEETLTLIVIPTTEADEGSPFVAGVYNSDTMASTKTTTLMGPSEGDLEGSPIFQWPSSELNAETVHSLVIENLDTGDVEVIYSPGASSYVWRTATWAPGNYEVHLRATYLDFNNPSALSPMYIGHASEATSPVYSYTITNEGPVIDLGTALLETLDMTSTDATYKFHIAVEDASDMSHCWLYYSTDGGNSYTLAIMQLDNQTGNTFYYNVEFDAALADSLVCKIIAEDAYGYRSEVKAVILPGAVKTIRTTITITQSPGFELIFALFAMAALAVVFTRKRE